jgi:hypothetical protein
LPTGRGIAAIEQALQHSPVHLVKRNRSAAVVLSEQHYRQLQVQASRAPVAEASALQWLLALPPSSTPRSKAEIDAELAAERDWCLPYGTSKKQFDVSRIARLGWQARIPLAEGLTSTVVLLGDQLRAELLRLW